MGYTTKKRTAGYTTTGTRGPEDIEYVTIGDQRVYVKPKPLMMRSEPKRDTKPIGEGSQAGSQQPDGSVGAGIQKSQDTNQKDAAADKDKNKASMSQHSQLTSSLMETSEDEDAKKKEAEKNAKKGKKGFTEAELNQIIDVELSETSTITLMYIPGTVVNHDTEEHAQATQDNKNYDLLK